MVKELHEGQSFLEAVAYVIRNIGGMREKPRQLTDGWFDLLFESSERKNIAEDTLRNYDKMVRDEIQIQAEKEFAVEMAVAKARAEADKATAVKMRALGLPDDIISQVTGLAGEDIPK